MYNATVKTTFSDFGVIAVFLYDASGLPVGIAYRTSDDDSDTWTNYWFERNLQGDVVAIYNNSGTKLATYTYDAWGNHNLTYYNGGASHVPVANNPIRYRGNYYDIDLGFYYLQTRYYDAKLCRFISSDGYVSTGSGLLGYNMYAYCNNNPVMYVDPSGDLFRAIVDFFARLFGKSSSSSSSSSSNNSSSRYNANATEIRLSIFNPLAALEVIEAKNIADEYVAVYYGDNKDGTESNAFRHAMWNAVMTDKIGEKKAKKFADAHESDVNNPANHKHMDLHNNALGRRIAIEYAGKGYDVFADKIKEAIENGEAVVIIWDP